jgi:hypothetical protein
VQPQPAQLLQPVLRAVQGPPAPGLLEPPPLPVLPALRHLQLQYLAALQPPLLAVLSQGEEGVGAAGEAADPQTFVTSAPRAQLLT